MRNRQYDPRCREFWFNLALNISIVAGAAYWFASTGAKP